MNIKEQKPVALKGIADDSGKSEDEINKLWDKELDGYDKSESELTGEDYGILIGKVKDAAGIKGDVNPDKKEESKLSLQGFLESTKSAKAYIDATIIS
jgi:hypothetical protein